MTYLDNNATTQLDPAVVEEMLPYLTSDYGNPSSGYSLGARARAAIDLARERVAALLGCAPDEIVFTSCGTESNNAAINSALQLRPGGAIVTTAVEHSAIRRHCEALGQAGSLVSFLGVDTEGNLDLDQLQAALQPETAILSVMWANNETGVLFPIAGIAEIARRQRVLFHTDAIQVAGKLPLNLSDVPINYLSLSAHKLHGPKGVGALYLNRRSPFRSSIIGGGQENQRRAGTENVSGIVGFGKAAECASAAIADEDTLVRAARDRFEAAILLAVPAAYVNGNRLQRLPNTSSFSFAGIESDAALIMLDHLGVCCSAGSACRTGSGEASHVLRAMGLGEERTRGSLRFSFSRFNSAVDLDKAIELVPQVIAKLRELT